MVVKVYISGLSGNKEVKKRQQRVALILDSKNVQYELLDIAEPNMEEAKEYMQNNSKLMGGTIGDPNPRHPLPPQIFNDDEYCGDYDAFDMANETDELEKFLKLPIDEVPKVGNGEIKETTPLKQTENEIHENGTEHTEESSSIVKEEEQHNDGEEKTPDKEITKDNTAEEPITEEIIKSEDE